MRRSDDDFADEIESHIQLEADRLVDERGLTPEAAAAEARRSFGNVTSHRERFHERSRWIWFERGLRDTRHAVRRLGREPRFTLAAVATIALCLGAVLAVCAVADAILWRPLPLAAAHRLVTIHNTYPGAGVLDDGASVANYAERRDALPQFASVSLLRPGTAIIGESGSTARENILMVTPEFFRTVGVALTQGRAFTDADTERGAEPVAILTDAAWRGRFAGTLSTQTIRANGAALRVVGTLPSSFSWPDSDAAIFVPLPIPVEQRPSSERHSGSNSEMVARLADGVTTAAAQQAIDAQNNQLERQNPQAAFIAGTGFRSVVTPLRDKRTAAVRTVVWLMCVGALGLFAVGCANLVNLVLVRSSGQMREVAVRTALGASRFALATSIVIEMVALATAGGWCAFVVGAAGVRGLHVLGVDRLPLGSSVAIDGRAGLLCVVGAILLGLVMSAPALWFTFRARTPQTPLLQSRSATASRRASQWRHAFVAVQIAAALVLLTSSALLGLSLLRAMRVVPGFRADAAITGEVTLPWTTYRAFTSRYAFAERTLTELRRQPGVVAAGVTSNIPLSGNDIKSAITFADAALNSARELHGYYAYWVGGDYFTALGVTVLAGRALTPADTEHGTRVCVVDEDFARRNFGAGSALGQRLFQSSKRLSDADAFTIVGVVQAVSQAAVTDRSAQGAVYFPLSTFTDSRMYFVVRSAADAMSVGATMSRIVRTIDPELPVTDVRTMASRLSGSLTVRRSPAVVTAVFAAAALLLAGIGTFGVVSYAVAQRRREIGLRLALGADPARIRRHFLRMGWQLCIAGVPAGLMGSWFSGRLMQAVLFDVPAVHWPTLCAATTALIVLTLLACVLPAQQAANVSPAIALTED